MKLTKEGIVEAGMATFAEVGYHGLSMRLVADRLDAKAGSLYYHVRDKTELLAMMADRVSQDAYDAGTAALAELGPHATWQEQVRVQASALRHSIRQHRGGAMLLADSPRTLSRGALSLMERLLRTLRDAGIPVGPRLLAADTLLSHITGFVLQEQNAPEPPTITAETYAELRGEFPLVFDEAPRWSEDEKFEASVGLLCAAFEPLVG